MNVGREKGENQKGEEMEGGEEGRKAGEGSTSKPQRREHPEKADSASLISRHLVETLALDSYTLPRLLHLSPSPGRIVP